MKELLRIETISEAMDFMGLPKPKHPLVSIVHAKDFPVSENMTKYKFVFNFYQIMYKDQGCGTMNYGRSTYDFQEGTMLFIGPNQSVDIDRVEPQAEDNKGWVIMIHPDLFLNSELSDKIRQYTFFEYQSDEALHLSDEELHLLQSCKDNIIKEYDQFIDRHSQQLLISNIELMLNYCLRYYDRQFYTRTNMSRGAVKKFEDLLIDYYQENKQHELGIPSVKYCGEQLTMSANYLSDLLKKETGKNASEHIQDFVMQRAKSRLLSTVDSVSTIAFDLGYEYSQHFNKVFKRKTGMTPGQYRQQN